MGVVVVRHKVDRPILNSTVSPTRIVVYNHGPEVVVIGPPEDPATDDASGIQIQPMNVCVIYTEEKQLSAKYRGLAHAVIEVT